MLPSCGPPKGLRVSLECCIRPCTLAVNRVKGLQISLDCCISPCTEAVGSYDAAPVASGFGISLRSGGFGRPVLIGALRTCSPKSDTGLPSPSAVLRRMLVCRGLVTQEQPWLCLVHRLQRGFSPSHFCLRLLKSPRVSSTESCWRGAFKHFPASLTGEINLFLDSPALCPWLENTLGLLWHRRCCFARKLSRSWCKGSFLWSFPQSCRSSDDGLPKLSQHRQSDTLNCLWCETIQPVKVIERRLVTGNLRIS